MNSNKSILFLFSMGLILPLAGLLWLTRSDFAYETFYNIPLHFIVLFVTCGISFFEAGYAYRLYEKNKSFITYIFSISFGLFALAFLVHGLVVPGNTYIPEEIFDATEHYGLFFGALILLFGTFFPSNLIDDNWLFKNRKLILTSIIFLFVAWLGGILYSDPFLHLFYNKVDFITVATAVLISLSALGFIKHFFRAPSYPALFYTLGFITLIYTGIIPVFYEEWNLIWWYFHIVLLLGFGLFLFGTILEKEGNAFFLSFKGKSSSTRIGFKIFVAFGVIGFLPMFFLNALNNKSNEKVLQKEITNKMVFIAETKEGQVFAFLDGLKSRTEDFASDGFIRDQVKVGVSENSELSLSDHLRKNKQPLDETLLGIFVTDIEGTVIASTDSALLGTDESEFHHFLSGKSRVTIMTREKYEPSYFSSMGVPLMVSAPIRDKINGALVGVLVNVFDTSKLQDILTGKFQIDQGALTAFEGEVKGLEIYMVNRDKSMFVHPNGAEYHEHLMHSLKEIDTVPVNKCINDEGEVLGELYENYKGVEVVGASMCIPNIGWTLLVEIEKDFALLPISISHKRSNLLIWITGFFMLFGSVIVSKLISKPIEILIRGARELGEGKLDTKVNVSSDDEIGELADVFNKTAGKLSKVQNDLKGKVKELEGSANSLSEKNKSLSETKEAMTNILEDIEEEKKRSEGLSKRLELATKSAKIGVWDWDVVENILIWDENMYALYGIKKENFSGAYEAWQQGLHPEDKKRGDAEMQMALKGEKDFDTTLRVIWPDKTVKYIRAYGLVQRDKNGKPIKMIGVNWDVTKEKEVDKAKTEFVSLASHQLRTPLSSINWYAEMLLAGDAGKLNEDQKKFLDEIYKGNQRMVDLVNALLNVSRLELGTFIVEPEPVDIVKIAQNALDEQKPQIDKKELKVKITVNGDMPTIQADPKLLSIVFQNFLSNAVKYTPDGGEIEFIIELADEIF